MLTYLSEETICVTKHCTSILGPIAWACRPESYHYLKLKRVVYESVFHFINLTIYYVVKPCANLQVYDRSYAQAQVLREGP